ncbi:MAG TPA: hypothetical protein VHU44_02215 [Acidobacteriaceae bacterium]|jgi:hypothetical protein|nr:hypothetical protein [Acidobacteriaceae bacterium]
MALSKTTQDHDTIRKWAEARGAMPAEVSSTAKGKQTGILRFAFPKARNHKDENLNEISWEEFFEKFDQNGLELVFQEKTSDGAKSNFNKLIYPEDEHASSKSKGSSGRTSSSTRSANSGKSGSSSRSADARSTSHSSRGSSGKSSSSSAGRGSNAGKSSATGRGSSSNATSSGRTSSTRKRAA